MQDINIKTEPKPSKLYFYQRFYEDLENYEKKIDKFSVTDFACGGSKILGIVKPHYYQGVDLKEDMILESRNVYSKFNYNFHSADITSFNSGVKTNFGLCIQTGFQEYKIELIPIIPVNNTIEDITKQYTLILEKIIRKYPEQNFWFHNRWKTTPMK